MFTVTTGKAKVGVALGPGVSVTVGVRVVVGVRLGTAVSVGSGVRVIVSVGKTVSVAVAGRAEGVACGVAKAGKLQAKAIKPGIRKKKTDFRIPLFYNLFCILSLIKVLYDF